MELACEIFIRIIITNMLVLLMVKFFSLKTLFDMQINAIRYLKNNRKYRLI